jgi:hypothetical protein
MFVTKNIANARYSICKSCDKFIPVIKTCNVCRCIMPAKIRLADYSCPLNKWEADILNITSEDYKLNE